jgi:hypothetical protein
MIGGKMRTRKEIINRTFLMDLFLSFFPPGALPSSRGVGLQHRGQRDSKINKRFSPSNSAG